MSATNRKSERRERDLYKTPEEAFKPLVPYIKDLSCEVWEPACGDRRLINWMQEAGITADGTDIADGHDFMEMRDPVECLVTNPPFSLAFEFCQHAMAMMPKHVFLLLRLNFLASLKRREWFMRHEPSALFILSSRPSFTENGKTDATDYAWYYWGNAYKGIIHL